MGTLRDLLSVNNISIIYYIIGRGSLQICQGLPGEFRHHRVGVPEEQHQHPDPVQFSGLDSNHWNGLGHGRLFSILLIVWNGASLSRYRSSRRDR